MAERVFLFTLEVVGKCEPGAVEYWLRVAAHALQEAGFAPDDAQAIGIDGAGGAALDFPDPAAPKLDAQPANGDTRRLSDVPGTMR
jgi:hypothetical protein